MLRSYQDMRAAALGRGPATVAVAGAQDREVLEAVQLGIQAGLAEAILVGDEAQVAPLAKAAGIGARVRIVHETDLAEASLKAAALVRSGEAQVLMKGLVNSAVFLKAALDADRGLRTGRLLSHLAAFEVPGRAKLEFLTDGGMNIAPGLEEKKQILANALDGLARMGVKDPKVAVLSANEQVSPKLQSSVDAKAIADAWGQGEFPGCVLEGPIAVDVAVSPEAARHKGLPSRITGEVDLFLVPNIDAGNMLAKSMIYYGGAKMAGVVLGALRPIVMVSRADHAEAKLNAIAMAALVA
jgi:phosphate butyryltransferase